MMTTPSTPEPVDDADLDPRTAELARALERKTALVHEIDHRVKNNLQLISSLLLLQARRMRDPVVRKALTGMLERINAIATVHRRLFHGEDLNQFDVADFTRDLTDDAISAAGRDDIAIDLRTTPSPVPATMATPLALVINELLLNAINHAFPNGRGGRITLTVAPSDKGLRIEIADDGVGMAHSTTSASASAGLGLTIVELLAQQLRASLYREDAGPGVRTILELPVEKLR